MIVQQKQAAWVAEGDIIVNVGVVDSITPVGVFIVFGVRGTISRLSDGRMDVETFDVVRHQTEDVAIEILTDGWLSPDTIGKD